jgi:hypothetical protein
MNKFLKKFLLISPAILFFFLFTPSSAHASNITVSNVHYDGGYGVGGHLEFDYSGFDFSSVANDTQVYLIDETAGNNAIAQSQLVTAFPSCTATHCSFGMAGRDITFSDTDTIYFRVLAYTDSNTFSLTPFTLTLNDGSANTNNLTRTFLNDTSLYAYYKLSDSSDSKNSNTLTNYNSASFDSGKFGNAVDFGTSGNECLYRTDSNGLTDTGPYSVSLWVKLNAEPSSGSTYQLVNAYTGATQWLFNYQNNGGTYEISFGRWSGSSFQGPTYNVDLGTSSWHHIVMTWDGSYIRGYLDGSLVGGPTAASGATGSGYTPSFTIGCNGNSYTANNAEAKFDDVAVFTRALSSDEDSLLYSSGTDLLSTADPSPAGVHFATAFDASKSQYMTAPDSSSLSITGPLTIEANVKFSSTPTSGNSYAIVAKWDQEGTGLTSRSYYAGLKNDSGTLKSEFDTSSNGGNSGVTEASWSWTPTIGVWYQLAWVFDGSGNAIFYVNGTSQGTVSGQNTSISDQSQDLYIGSTGNGSGGEEFFFDGALDDIRIWNTARSSTNINNYLNAYLTGAESGLAAYYPFE